MITAQKIIEEIKSRPPLQWDEASKHYIGIRVLWDVQFSQCFYPNDNDKTIITIHAQSKNATVAFQVNPNNYPELKVMREGDSFKINGEIKEIEFGYLIVLKEPALIFPDTTTFQKTIKSNDQKKWYKTWWGALLSLILGVLTIILGAFCTNYLGLTH
ncbi:MAG: hypothetical protein PHS04_17010 [Tissierellia bacterium]|nr:hypothetical protein [Tissierellia bacterium]